MRSLLASLATVALLVGCWRGPYDTTDDEVPELTTLATSEVAQLARSVDRPVIVEFSVLHGCARCAQMRPWVRKLAVAQADKIAIQRADFVANQPFLQSIGATVCPSYVLFMPGSPPQMQLSLDLLLSMVDPIENGSDLSD